MKTPLQRLVLAALIGLCGAVTAIPALTDPLWTLAPGLQVAPLENFQLHWQPLEAPGVDRALVGSVGGEPGYFIAARAIKVRRERQQWASLEKQLRQLADKKPKQLFAGRTATAGGDASYRAYRYQREGEPVAQLFHLVELDGRAYWVFATAVAPMRLDQVLPVTEALVRRAYKKAGH